MKKVLIVVLCIVSLVFGTKILWNVLIDAGYIPFTEEYDKRFYLKQYKKCEKEFQALKKEIELYVEYLPESTRKEYDEIHFSNPQSLFKFLTIISCNDFFNARFKFYFHRSIKCRFNMFDFFNINDGRFRNSDKIFA